jgi:simple sugar transport system substrate-binding protein
MRRARALLGVAGAAVLALSLTACGDDEPAPTGDDTIVVGFVAVGPEGAWRAANEQNVKDTFTAAAGFDLRYAPAANNDQQTQIAAFTSFVDAGVDVILLSATEATGWESSLRRAQEAEIPVILVDRGIEPNDTSLYVTRIAPDNVEVAKSVANWAVAEFPEGAKYFTLEGPPGVGVVNERNNGWDSVIGSKPEFVKVGAQTANWSAEEAKSVFETVLSANNNDIQLVFAQNDEMGLGAALAVEAAGLTPGVDVKIATIDGTRNALEALADGRLTFVAEYNPLFGETLLEVVEKALNGQSVESYIIVESLTFDSPEAAQAALPNRKF